MPDTQTDQCEHGAPYDAECGKCDQGIAEAKVAGAWTPHEIGLYWKGRRVAATDPRIDKIRALIPTENPELIEAGYGVLAADLLAVLDATATEEQP